MIATINNIETIILSSIINKIENFNLLLENIQSDFFINNNLLKSTFMELKKMYSEGSTSFQEITLFLTQKGVTPEKIKALIEIEHEYTTEFLLNFFLEKVSKIKLEEAFKKNEDKPLHERLSILSSVSNEINELNNFEEIKDANHVVEEYKEYLDDMNEKQLNNNGIVGISTGLTELDQKTMGLKNTDYIVVAGRPSMGKTAFTLGMITSTIYADAVPVFFSLEMPSKQIMGRLLSQINSELSLNDTLYASSYGEKKDSIHNLLEFLKTKDFFIEDFIQKNGQTKRKITVTDLDKRCASISAKGIKIGAIFVDYLQLLSSEIYHNASTNDKIADISNGLKTLGKKWGCPVVALSQLNRDLERRQDKRPMMSDLRESGAIEQDADIIMFVYRPAVYLEKEIKEKLKSKPNDMTLQRELEILQNSSVTEAEIIVGKNRNGPTGYVQAAFIKKTSAFVNPAREADDPFYTGEDIYL